MSNKKTIAIDFDGTITKDSPFPTMGKVRKSAKKYIKKLYKKGYCLVLWTCRDGEYYKEAIQCLKDNNIYKYFSFYPLVYKEKTSLNHKVLASFYIDDRSIPGKIHWKKIYKYIIKNI